MGTKLYRGNQVKQKVGIIGGGIIGLSTGWQLAKKGFDVEILERENDCKGAAWVSAGMLAPQAELGFEEFDYFSICMESLKQYPKFLQEIEADSGIKVSLKRCGTLMAAFDRDQTERLERIKGFRDKANLPGKWLTGSEAKEIEPLLSPKCTCGLLFEQDAEVDNRKLLQALKKAFINSGGKLYQEHEVESVNIVNGKAEGLHFHGIDVKYDYILAAAGSWCAKIKGLEFLNGTSIKPVKGQIISLGTSDSFKLDHAVRANDVYIVEKSDNRIIIGATVEDFGYDTTITAGAVLELLDNAWEAIPAISELNLQSVDAGLRPGSLDNQPVLGRTEVDGLFVAGGHYRSGVLLAPITAYNMASMIAGESYSDMIDKFSINRFQKHKV
jgi:glycine oxidase